MCNVRDLPASLRRERRTEREESLRRMPPKVCSSDLSYFFEPSLDTEAPGGGLCGIHIHATRDLAIVQQSKVTLYNRTATEVEFRCRMFVQISCSLRGEGIANRRRWV